MAILNVNIAVGGQANDVSSDEASADRTAGQAFLADVVTAIEAHYPTQAASKDVKVNIGVDFGDPFASA